jgi:hypothetical protein
LNNILLTLSIPFVGIFFNLIFLIFLRRIFRNSIFFNLQLISSLIGLFFVFFIYLFFNFESNSIFFWDFLLCSFFNYLFLVFILFNIINASVGSLRIRILSEIFFYKNKRITYKKFLKIYSLNRIIDIRITKLIIGNQIQLIGGKFYAKGFFIKIINYIFVVLKKIIY